MYFYHSVDTPVSSSEIAASPSKKKKKRNKNKTEELAVLVSIEQHYSKEYGYCKP